MSARSCTSLLVFALGSAACLNDGHAPDPTQTTVRRCAPETEGYADAAPLSPPSFSLPEGCRILEDDGRVALFRRQVTSIVDSAGLDAACAAAATIPDAGRAPFDGGMDASPIDFSMWRLLVIRIPDTTFPRFGVTRGEEVILGESSAICTGIDPKARRYLQLVPRTATVSFHLCEPEGCEEDPS